MLPAPIRLMRPKQWIKNLFVFGPLVFAGAFLELPILQLAGFAFVLFCLTSSAIYIFNDMRDVEADRAHPKKSKTRPLAAGQMSLTQARILFLVLIALVVVGCFFLPQVYPVLWAYFLLNLAYCIWLKYQPVVDIFTIAIGFVLRVYAGAVAISVPVSAWMFVTTLCLALFLAAIKRRQEMQSSGSEGRSVLQFYTPTLIDRYAEMSATGALVFYSLFVMSERPEMVVSIPFVLFGLFRYWFVVECSGKGESPTDALTGDWQLLATVLGWVGVCLYAIWPAQ